MSYTALYRKYRPVTFEDVKGQDHIVTTLRNQIKSERLGHAYLFTGTRGTGKTTIAKILARTVNCQNPTENGPCGECDSCKSILSGNNMNVIEIDAASNNGVDNIREIIEEVSYSPVNAKYKVYIIDEVHMLSTGAFNALLKTLEEPPSYCIFILATTDVQKIPITILSRCQRYDFRRISIDTIAARLKELSEIENISADERALRYVAKVADGSMRDALSLLDQCVAFNYGENLSYEKALEILGAVDTSVFSRLLRLVIDNNIIGCIELIEDIIMQGRELGQFVTDFIWYLRNLMLVKSCDSGFAEDVLEVSGEHMEALRQEAEMLDMNGIFRYINVFCDLSSRMKYASQKRILLEVTVIKLCKPQMETDSDSVLERVRMIEDVLADGIPVTSIVGGEASVSEGVMPKEDPELEARANALPEDIKHIIKDWNIIKGKTEGRTKVVLSKVYPVDGNDNTVILRVADKFDQTQLMDEEKKAEIEQLFSDYIGKNVQIDVRLATGNGSPKQEHEKIQSFFPEGITVEIDNNDSEDIF